MISNIQKLIQKALSHEGFLKYFTNTSWMFFEQILRMFTGLLVGVWVARYLGPEKFGTFSYVIAFASIFGTVAKLGLDSILVRDLVNYPLKRDAYLGTAFWLKLIGALVMLLVTMIVAMFTSNDLEVNFYVFIIASGVIFQSFEVIDFYFQSKVLSKFVSVCKLVQLLISSLLKIYFVLTGADLLLFVIVSLVDQVTLAIALHFAYKYEKNKSFYCNFDLNIALQLLKTSWPVVLGSFVLMIQARADQVMLKEMLGDVEVGYYSSAMRLVEVFGFIPMVLSASLLPAILNAKKVSVDLYKKRFFNLYRLMMVLFLIVAIPIYFFGKEIILLVYTNTFSPAGEIFSLLSLRIFFTNYGVVRAAYLMSENLMKYSMLTMFVGVVINLILNWLWIPNYRSAGAVWASLISFFVVTFLIDFLYYKTRDNCKLMFKSMLIVNFREIK